MNIEPGKFYRTRDGRKVRIYATDGGDGYPVHGAIFEGGSWLTPDAWEASGAFVEHTSQEDEDIIAEWTEPHPLAGAKPGDPIWVRGYSEVWFFTRFKELREGDETPVIASNRADMSMPCAWSEGKPYVPGEKP